MGFLQIRRGYIKDGAGSPLAVGSVDLHSGSKAGKSREAELQNLQTGKSIGTVTLFLLPGRLQDSSSFIRSFVASLHQRQTQKQGLKQIACITFLLPDMPLHNLKMLDLSYDRKKQLRG